MELVGVGETQNSWAVFFSDKNNEPLAWVDHNGDGLIEFVEGFHPDKIKYVWTDPKDPARGLALMFVEIWNLRQRVKELESKKK